MVVPQSLPAPLAPSDAPGEAPDEIGIAPELMDLERELQEHEDAALAIRRRIAELAPHVDDRFGALLQQQDDIDDWLADPKFDAKAFARQLRRKTDQMQFMVENLMKKRAEGLAESAKPIATKARAIARNRENLRDAIVAVMQEHHYDRVPGIVWAVRLRDNSNPKLEIDRDLIKIYAEEIYACSVDDWDQFRDYVTRESIYRWNTDKLRDDLKAGKKVSAPARLTRGQWPEFVPNVPAQLDKPKKPRSKKQ